MFGSAELFLKTELWDEVCLVPQMCEERRAKICGCYTVDILCELRRKQEEKKEIHISKC